MAARLGIAVGTANSGTAAISSTDDAECVTTSRSTVLYLPPDGAARIGGAPAAPGERTLAGFVPRVGDPVGILDDAGQVHPGADLFATAVSCLIDEACHHPEADNPEADSDTDEPATVVVTRPTAWSSYTARALESALARAGLSEAVLVSEADACMRWLEESRGPLQDGLVVVYDLGASTLDITLIRTGTEPAMLGKPIRSEDFGGAQFDHLVTQYVLGALADRVDGLDPFDPDTTAALSTLRAHCAAAKEALSTDTEAVIPVALPGVDTDVRLIRSELEDLIRTPLSASLELVRDSLRFAGLEVSDVTHVLLAGGGGSIPLIAELISSELGLTVIAAPTPGLTAALGAAHIAGDTEKSNTFAASIFSDYDAIRPKSSHAGEVTASFPSRMHAADRGGPNVRRRMAIIASSAAAIAVLAAGGLSIGTVVDNVPAQSAPTSATPVTTTAGGSSTGAASPDGVVDAITVFGSTLGSGTAAPASAGSVPGTRGDTVDATVRPAGQPAAPGTQAPSAQPDPRTTAPDLDVPAGDAAVAPPAYTPPAGPPPAPAPGGNTAGQIGEGIGKAATGIGNGVGGVVTGIGNGVGGVVTGLGNVVGAVVDPVTGLLIGK
ncbi:Hsp70 family protein [Rhodococcus sp. ABRD24]|uniref:Hsp70 family protein n=1 Tax=Rhodococcus sp. ABRD24 TaxID=2507582 RepID=UPI00103E14E9|nr:Hsp70 family protein [Rhodococcus sp. ABRD24]QBJ95963.1 Hsp70 family protein [Rhodococcus sp. ABRD24]